MRRFAFRLALASGYWVYNPDEMLARMPYRIFEDWLAYHEEEPFGQMPFRLGYAAAALGNLWAKPKGKRAWQPTDFMPDRAPSARIEGPNQQLNKMLSITTMLGGKINDPKGILRKQNA